MVRYASWVKHTQTSWCLRHAVFHQLASFDATCFYLCPSDLPRQPALYILKC
uniref:Uncharacterized protein n=1 Tax=Arundo donax TaxID=35708 RepID=A0A0A9BVN8_ARUDO